MFNLVSYNKFRRSRLTFDRSAKVAYIVVPSLYLNIVFSETTWPIEIKCHMTTLYDWLAKIYTNCYVKYPSSLKPKSDWLWDLVCSIGDVGPTRFAQLMNLD